MNEIISYTENEQTIDEIEIESFLNALESAFVQARKSAIISLQNYFDAPGVISALKKRVEIEDDLDCIENLQQIIALAETKKISEPITYPEKPDDLAKLWFKAQSNELQAISNWVSSLKPNIQADFICKVIDEAGDIRQEKLLSLFVNRKFRCFHKPEVTARLVKLISTKNTLLLVKVLTILGNSKPDTILPRLPKLLLHKLLQIRLQAIRILYKTLPSEAIRLLQEIIFSNSATHMSSALHLFFLIPFNHIADILIRLIDMKPLTTRDEKLVCHLIYNNPDKIFFEKLTLLYLRRKEEIPRLGFYWKIAAKALILAEIVDVSEAELLKKAIKDARQFVFQTSGIDILHEGELFEIEKKDIEKEKKDTLDRFQKIKNISGEQIKELLSVCQSMSEEKDILRAIKTVKVAKANNPHLIKWLEGLFDQKNAKITNLVMATIVELDKKCLLPHLRYLVSDTNPMVAGQSIRLYRKHFPDEFTIQIKNWINENNKKSWKAALAGLMQMSIEKARIILLHFFETKESPDLIKFFGPVFVITPDRESVYALLAIATKSSKLKRSSLTELIEQLKSELTVFSEFEDSSVKKQWEEAIIKIKQIHYYTGGALGSKSWRKYFTNPIFIFFIIFMMATGIYTLTYTKISNDEMKDRARPKVKETFILQIPKGQQKEFLATKLQNFEAKMLAKPMIKPRTNICNINSLQSMEAISTNLNDEMQHGIKLVAELKAHTSHTNKKEVSNESKPTK